MAVRARTRSDVELPQSLRLVRHLPARATACSQSYGPPQASNNPQRPPPVAATRRSTHVRLTAPQESPRTSTHRRHWEQTPQGPSPAPALDSAVTYCTENKATPAWPAADHDRSSHSAGASPGTAL